MKHRRGVRGLPSLPGLVCLLGLFGSLPAVKSAHAEARPVTLDFDGCAALVDTDETLALLRPELPSTGSQAFIVAPRHVPVAPGTIVLAMRCGDQPQLSVRLDDAALESISLVDVPPRMRARTLALALAERLRRFTLEPPAPPAAPPIVVLAGSPAPSLLSVAGTDAVPEGRSRNPKRMKAAGQASLGLLLPALAGFIAGAPIAAIGDADPARGDLRGDGAVILSLSIAPLAAAAATFGVWLREKRKLPAPHASTSTPAF